MFLLSSEDLMSILSCRYGFAALAKATSKSQSEARERYISAPLRSRDRKLTPKLCLLPGVWGEQADIYQSPVGGRRGNGHGGEAYPFRSKALMSMCCRTSSDVI